MCYVMQARREPREVFIFLVESRRREVDPLKYGLSRGATRLLFTI